jgi:hypothetical protein
MKNKYYKDIKRFDIISDLSHYMIKINMMKISNED